MSKEGPPWEWNGSGYVDRKGYVRVYCPDHPRSWKKGQIAEHTLVAENALGRLLPEGAVVHHVDENPSNNSPDNLVICEDLGYHHTIHRRMRAYEACGDPDWLMCNYCKEYDDPDNMYVQKGDVVMAHYHVECKRR